MLNVEPPELRTSKHEIEAEVEAELAEVYGEGRFGLSFELFPPKTEAGERALYRHVEKLVELAPSFITCTYGAGGSTQGKTLEIIDQVKRRFQLPVASHLTCVGSTVQQLREYLAEAKRRGADHIVALRGDPPDGASQYTPHPGGYENAADLIAGLKEVADFEISVAAYPEVHPDSPDAQSDIDNLKAKFDAGADRAITQFFFDPECFFRFRDKVAAAGIEAEIVPGIMPVMSFAAVQRMSGMCGTDIPGWMEGLFDGLDERPAARQLVSATIAAELCRKLYAGGVRQFHFYTLNRAELSYAICHMLGKRPVGGAA